MKRWLGVVIAVFTLAALTGCRKSEQAVSAGDVEAAVERSLAELPERNESQAPCDVLTDELLQTHFAIEGTEVKRSAGGMKAFPLCTASWEKPDAEEIRAASAAKMQEWMMKQMQGDRSPMPALRTDNEVTLTLVERVHDSPAEAIASFDSAMANLERGITASHGDVEATFQADLVPVSGVGEKAMWAPSMRQLSVVTSRRMFHVGVHTGGELDNELEKARELARAIASRI